MRKKEKKKKERKLIDRSYRSIESRFNITNNISYVLAIFAKFFFFFFFTDELRRRLKLFSRVESNQARTDRLIGAHQNKSTILKARTARGTNDKRESRVRLEQISRLSFVARCARCSRLSISPRPFSLHVVCIIRR